MSGHIVWRDDLARTCQCGHEKGTHAIRGRCLTLTIPPVNGGPGCPCQTFQPQEERMPDKTVVFQDKAGEFRWRRVAPNGETIADSGESYTRLADAERAAARVFGDQADDEGMGRDA